jgi:hypothetical protein
MYFAPHLLCHIMFSVNESMRKVNFTQNISRIYSTLVYNNSDLHAF